MDTRYVIIKQVGFHEGEGEEKQKTNSFWKLKIIAEIKNKNSTEELGTLRKSPRKLKNIKM